MKGEILLDRDIHLKDLQHELEWPSAAKEHLLLLEFSKFLRTYLQSKEHLMQGHISDAYDNVLEALQHWAKIVIIEAGFNPKTTVWNQLKSINPGVYKLFEELTSSHETLTQRVQLVLLASEFSVMNKMQRCCQMLLRVLSGRDVAWSLPELQQNHLLSGVSVELPMLLEWLVKKSLAKEIIYTIDEQMNELEIRYTGV
ncbi:hypothetical protein [Paenibacillus xerothermodurans]|uniref:YgxA-like substrate binding domain-containing protein n=1 Tax=Paenibacillus xerothermodurans TaxID=1977292 RepID=A0A2W1NP24_PAEXE|nr:hypothetical protein [Paenibacillus xerothermodurans]PZE20663.1 hypothetical protein CBW46_010820 [Paenibacillus xerothermodurans]